MFKKRNRNEFACWVIKKITLNTFSVRASQKRPAEPGIGIGEREHHGKQDGPSVHHRSFHEAQHDARQEFLHWYPVRLPANRTQQKRLVIFLYFKNFYSFQCALAKS